MQILELLAEDINPYQRDRIELAVKAFHRELELAKIGHLESHTNIIQYFIDQLRSRGVTLELIVYALESQKEPILSYLKSLQKIKAPYFFVSRIIKNVWALKGMLPTMWPEVMEIVDAGKPIILKKILMNVKALTPFPASETILDLRDLGVRWPELAMIQKSIDADNKDEENLDEAKNTRTVRNNDALKDVIDDLKYFTTVDLSVEGIKSCILMLADYGMSRTEIKTTLTKFKKPILNFLNVLVHNPNRHYDDLPKWFEIILILVDNGKIEWPELLSVIESQKSTIIKILLKAVKESDFGSVNYTLKHLAKFKINWPELTVIKNSVEAEAANRRQKTNTQIDAN